MNAVWIWSFLTPLKVTEVTGVLLIYLTDGGILFRNRSVSGDAFLGL